jgi:hypothetical protein
MCITETCRGCIPAQRRRPCCCCCPHRQVAPSLLLVKDAGGAVFGAYVSESWRYNPRFYGSGEVFVYQVTMAAHTFVSFMKYLAVAATQVTLPIKGRHIGLLHTRHLLSLRSDTQ